MMRLFRKTPDQPINFALLGADMHAHLLPGIDDGAPDMDTAVRLMRGLKQLGYRKLIATPHVMPVLYPNTRDQILTSRDQLLEHLQKIENEMPEFEAAAEYYIDEQFEALIRNEPLLALPGNQVLVELSFHQPYPAFHQVLFNLQMKGYTPVLAHPERYHYFQYPEFQRLKELGCRFQVNILSLTGYYGAAMMKTAKKLHQNNWIDFLGTDLHHERHLSHLKKALSSELLADVLKKGNLQNRFLLSNSAELLP